MDGRQFDALAKSVGTAASRRQVLKGLVAAAGVGLAAAFGLRGSGSSAEEESLLGTPIAVEPDPTDEATVEPTLEPTSPIVETPEATATLEPTSTPSETPSPSPSPTPAKTSQPRVRVSATPVITVAPLLGKVGTNFTVSGTGFANGEAVQVSWFNGSTKLLLGSTTASAGEAISFNAPVPSAVRGKHRVRAEGATSGRADTFFSVQQRLKLQNTNGVPGSTRLLIVDGFAKNVAIDILFFPGSDATGTPITISTLTTSSTGRASLNWVVPPGATPGKHRMRAVEQVSRKLSNADFTVLCAGGLIDNGAGQCVQCQSAGQCPQPASALCGTATCTSGVCGITIVSAGTLVPGDAPFNCKKTVCDGQGRVISVNDDTDVPINTDPLGCRTPVCANGQVGFSNLPQRTPCFSAGTISNGMCDGRGLCVQCVADSDCPDQGTSFCGGGVCANGFCGFVASGTVLPSNLQLPNDCHKSICNGAGATVELVDETDHPAAAAGTCVDPLCVNGVPTNVNKPRGTTCSQGGGKLCDGSGKCLPCLVNADCPPSSIPNASKICAEVNAGGFFACIDQCNPGLDICVAAPNVCTPLNTTDNCGFCGITCPGETTTSDATCVQPVGGSSRTCQMTCKGDNFDVDGNAANGCEARNVFSTANRGGKTCGLGGQADTITGTIVSDNRAHVPEPASFNSSTGAVPHVYTATPRSGSACVGSAAVQVTTSGGSASACYRLKALVNGVEKAAVTMNGRETKSLSFAYTTGATVTFRLEKTCGAATAQKVNYTIGYRFL